MCVYLSWISQNGIKVYINLTFTFSFLVSTLKCSFYWWGVTLHSGPSGDRLIVSFSGAVKPNNMYTTELLIKALMQQGQGYFLDNLNRIKTIIQLVSVINTQTNQSIKELETSLEINNLHKKFPPLIFLRGMVPETLQVCIYISSRFYFWIWIMNKITFLLQLVQNS